MLTVGLLGALVEARRSLELSKPKTQVQWVDLAAPHGPVDLALRLLGDETPAPPSIDPGLVATWDHIPDHGAVDRMLQQALVNAYGFVVGYTDAMHQVCRWIQVLAHPMTQTTNVRALLVGPTGVGKDLVARTVARLGRRASQPFVAINCATLPRELIVAELFGAEAGAYTGLARRRPGLFQAAADGVLFLDEVSELPLELQPVLLRVLDEHAFRPLGSTTQIAFHAQIISATNRELASLIEGGAMRADLYYRLAHVVVPLPSLAERADDLDLLVRYLWRQVDDSDPPEDIIAEVARRAWPGNIRQLRGVIERAVLLRKTVGSTSSLLDEIKAAPAAQPVPSGTLSELRQRFERDVLVSIVQRCGGNIRDIARELGITQRSVYNLLKRHRIAPGK
ncbi:MAG: sigma-54-dependent Fis family transcriptional regulator [Deltaproteobacteria bacterium]|nr:MAG: sigma-54-dependent Fis family transcriptional regulator [Deltaproteobacteria bacterium]TMQ15942.1 MAG: sigma-54-dependent Fis family transcriptional regulator [Deltaproteobacteria bacterium]